MYTIDASVWVNAFDQREPGHQVSRQFLEVVRDQALPIIVPNVVLVEVAGAIDVHALPVGQGRATPLRTSEDTAPAARPRRAYQSRTTRKPMSSLQGVRMSWRKAVWSMRREGGAPNVAHS